jgi:hypothetical protein
VEAVKWRSQPPERRARVTPVHRIVIGLIGPVVRLGFQAVISVCGQALDYSTLGVQHVGRPLDFGAWQSQALDLELGDQRHWALELGDQRRWTFL